MKVLAAVLLSIVAVAGCRGDDPDNAPPIGLVEVATPAGRGPALDAPPVRATPTLAARRDALADDARRRLDGAWQACGGSLGEDAVRCRDDAMLAYDAAMRAARAVSDHAPASPAGVLDTHEEFAAVQVTGTRG